MHRGLGTATGALWLLVIISVAGCPFSPDKDKGDPPPVETFRLRTEPENLLHNLKQAYKDREVAEYESLLAMDFTFVLSEEDASKPDMPDLWGRNQEIEIHGRMFNAALVQTLSLDFAVGPLTFDQTDQMWSLTITNVILSLYGVTEAFPDTPKEYKVTAGTAKFWFRENSWNASGTNKPIWTIVKWEDDPI